jgi:hypothetical protein
MSQYQKAILNRYFDHLFQHLDCKSSLSSKQPVESNEKVDDKENYQELEKSVDSGKEQIVIKKVEGAFVTALTPIRLHKKEKETLGVEYAVSHVRRSTIKLPLMIKEVDYDGSKTDKMLNEYDYAYSPNTFIQK